MSDNSGSTMIEKAVDNKVLTLISRVSMSLMVITLPVFFGYLQGLGNHTQTLDTRLSVVENTQQRNQTLLDTNQVTLTSQVEELRKQNLLILQSIARIETRLNMDNNSAPVQ